MAITKVTRTLLSTGIVDNSNATAITIDSSENVGIGNTQATAINNASGLGNLVVGSGSGAEGITIYSGSDSYGGLNFADATSGGGSYAGYIKFNHVDNSFGHFIGNTERMRIDSSGNVGIGTSSPSNPLHLLSTQTDFSPSFLIKNSSTANGSIASLRFSAGSSATGFFIGKHSEGHGDANAVFINQETNAPMVFSTNGTERMRIDSSGNLQLGTTSSSQTIFQFLSATNGANTIHFGDGSSADAYRGYINYNHTGDRMEFATSGSEAMRIDGSGRVMLGTTSNSGVSNNADNLIVGDNTSAAEQGITLCSTLASGIRWNDGADAGLIEYIHSSNTMTFGTSGAERMRIDSSGSVHIDGAYSTGGRSKMFEINPNAIALKSSTNLTNFQYHQEFANPNGTVGSITTNGSATAFNTSSDYRLKENVDYDFTALDRVAQLKPARFNFIADADKTVDGFLAHEVQDIVPEAVAGEKDAVDDEGNPDYQGIDQSKLVPLLTKAIQEQQTIIDDLKTRIETLENA